MIKGWKPTPGNCYEDCFNLLREDPQFADAVLCHGWPTCASAKSDMKIGTVYGHAWLEWTEDIGVLNGVPVRVVLAMDAMHTGNPVPRDLFYMVGKIDPDLVRRYNTADAMHEALRAEHYGPWRAGPWWALEVQKKNKKKKN